MGARWWLGGHQDAYQCDAAELYMKPAWSDDTNIIRPAFCNPPHQLLSNMDCIFMPDLLALIICILGLIGNGISFHAFGKLHNQNVSTMLVRALAFVDSCVLVLWPFVSFMNEEFERMLHNHLKAFWIYMVFRVHVIQPLFFIARTAAIWTPVLIGFHRYIVTCKPLLATGKCTLEKARRHFIGVLLFSLLVNIPQFFRLEVKQVPAGHTNSTKSYMYVSEPSNVLGSFWATICYEFVFRTVIVNYLLPVTSLLFVTIRLKQCQRSPKQQRLSLRGGRRHGRSEMRLDLMLIVVLIVFMICHATYPLGRVYFMLDKYMSLSIDNLCLNNVIHGIRAASIILNSSVNCIIYVKLGLRIRPNKRQASVRLQLQQGQKLVEQASTKWWSFYSCQFQVHHLKKIKFLFGFHFQFICFNLLVSIDI